MIGRVIAFVAGLLSSLAFAGVSNAATVNFTLQPITIANEACFGQPSGPGGDGNCNYNFENPLASTVGVATSALLPFTMIFIAPTGNDTAGQNAAPDSFSFLATVRVLVNSVAFDFSALGTVTNWFPTSANSSGLNSSAALSWQVNAPPVNAPVRVRFLSTGPFETNVGEMPVDITIQAVAPAVVPLPAGVLLLGTALLGLFGLSRRRKLAAA